MPLRLVADKLHMPVETESDIQRLFETGAALSRSELGRSRYEAYRRDLADYFYYVGAVRPAHFRPLQEAMAAVPDEQLANFELTFPTWLALMHDAPASCVETLMRRLVDSGGNPSAPADALEQMLAAIGTPEALEGLAAYAERSGRRDEFENLGFWIPPGAPRAVPRFTRERRAVRVERFVGDDDDPEAVPHPVGLPLSTVVADPTQDVVVWHYCSFTLAQMEGLPVLPARRLHLVSPPLNSDWTVFSSLDADGRYADSALMRREETDPEEMADMRADARARAEEDRGYLTLLPYDDQLVYCNGHTEHTPGVVGDVGGPPIGLYPNPRCPTCGTLMFHVATVTKDVREYGDGFRSLLVCEDCDLTASHATMWN